MQLIEEEWDGVKVSLKQVFWRGDLTPVNDKMALTVQDPEKE